MLWSDFTRLLALFVSIAICSASADDAGQRARLPKDQWDYSSARGPDHWAELDPAYVLAQIGGSQSPIDIVPAQAIGADLPPLEVETVPQPLHVFNNGHTVEALCPGAAMLTFGGHVYRLQQFHFHAPSEHTIDGEHAAVEIHFVHADGAGHLAVLAVLFFEGEAEHPEVAELLAREATAHSGDEIFDHHELLDVSDFLPDSLDY